MIRLIIWKITFIGINFLKQLLGNRGPKVWHFAYGANVDCETLQTRGVAPFEEHIYIIEDYIFSFTHPGPFQGQGFADIQYQQGEKTFGKLYLISWWDKIRLHLFELAIVFSRHHIKWEQQEGKKFYFYQATDIDINVQPFCAYQDKIIKAYKNAGILLPIYEKKLVEHPCIVSRPIRTEGFHFTKEPKIKFLYKSALRYEIFVRRMMMKWYPHRIAGDE